MYFYVFLTNLKESKTAFPSPIEQVASEAQIESVPLLRYHISVRLLSGCAVHMLYFLLLILQEVVSNNEVKVLP